MADPTSGIVSPYMGQPTNVGKFINFTATSTGWLVKTGGGALFNVTLNKPVATSIITMYDGLDTNGTLIGTITIPASPMPVTLTYNLFFQTGLFVVVGTAAVDMTITFK